MKHIKNFTIFNEANVKILTFTNLKKKLVHIIRAKIYHDFQDLGRFILWLSVKTLIDKNIQSKKVYAIKDELYNNLPNIIESIDIREVHKLMEFFPDAFPSFMLKGEYTIELSDNGWIFISK